MFKYHVPDKVIVTHPADPQISVTVRCFGFIEEIKNAEAYKDLSREAVLEKKAEQKFESWTGIADKDGNPMPLTPKNAVDVLFDDSLAVDTGEPSDHDKALEKAAAALESTAANLKPEEPSRLAYLHGAEQIRAGKKGENVKMPFFAFALQESAKKNAERGKASEPPRNA